MRIANLSTLYHAFTAIQIKSYPDDWANGSHKGFNIDPKKFVIIDDENISSDIVSKRITETKKDKLTNFADISNLSGIIETLELLAKWQKGFQQAADALERKQFLQYLSGYEKGVNDFHKNVDKENIAKEELDSLKKGCAAILGYSNGLKAYFPKALGLMSKILEEIDKHNKE